MYNDLKLKRQRLVEAENDLPLRRTIVFGRCRSVITGMSEEELQAAEIHVRRAQLAIGQHTGRIHPRPGRGR